MTEQTENLILEHLRAIRLQLGRIEADVADIKGRMTTMEVTTAHLMANDAGQSGRMDRLEQRLVRVELRLELRDPG